MERQSQNALMREKIQVGKRSERNINAFSLKDENGLEIWIIINIFHSQIKFWI